MLLATAALVHDDDLYSLKHHTIIKGLQGTLHYKAHPMKLDSASGTLFEVSTRPKTPINPASRPDNPYWAGLSGPIMPPHDAAGVRLFWAQSQIMAACGAKLLWHQRVNPSLLPPTWTPYRNDLFSE